jgi:hypothetical protein
MRLHRKVQNWNWGKIFAWVGYCALSSVIPLLLVSVWFALLGILWLVPIYVKFLFWKDRVTVQLGDDWTFLNELGWALKVRRRIRIRLARRALGIFPIILLLLIGGFFGVLVVADDYDHLPIVIGFILTVICAGVVLLLIGYDTIRRVSDLFGDPYVLIGSAQGVSTDRRIEADEPKLSWIIIQATSEWFCPSVAVEIARQVNLTKEGAVINNRLVPQSMSLDLVSGASAVVTEGDVVLVCSAHDRCIGRLSQFQRTRTLGNPHSSSSCPPPGPSAPTS